MKALTYLIYIVFWESLVLGGFGYVIFVLGNSQWWALAALFFSMCAYRPTTWMHGIKNNEKSDG